ncbi:unnamed protein product, partial [Amoebophrya sp. A25]|eukprot:GSA25T00011649001.1
MKCVTTLRENVDATLRSTSTEQPLSAIARTPDAEPIVINVDAEATFLPDAANRDDPLMRPARGGTQDEGSTSNSVPASCDLTMGEPATSL